MSQIQATPEKTRGSVLLLAAQTSWERFSYYGMRALLVLYLIRPKLRPEDPVPTWFTPNPQNPGRGWSESDANLIYGWFAGLIFLLPVLTGLENVELPLLVSGVSSREARARARAGIERVGLLDWARHRPAEMSGGQRQRFAIARALATMPTIVWADEPTGALDSATSQEIIDLMLILNREHGLTFVWGTHALEVARQAHRLVTMRDGLVEGDLRLQTGSSSTVAAGAPLLHDGQ